MKIFFLISILSIGFALEVRFTTEREKYLKGGAVSVSAVVDVEVPPSEGIHSIPPVELVLVLDRSGSMFGDKIVRAKSAAKNIVEKMRVGDVFHLIAYDTEVDVIFHDGTVEEKEALLSLIDSVQADGWTNLSGGIEEAFRLLTADGPTHERDPPLGPRRLKRIFLLSDGLANVGVTSHNTLFQRMQDMHGRGITVCTFGVGEDHDRNLLTGLAQHGSGDYYYISEAKSIEQMVDHALRGLGSTFGLNGRLYLQPLPPAVTDLKVGSGSSLELESGFPLNDLRFGSKKTFYIEMRVNTDVVEESQIPLLNWKLSYEPAKKDDKSNVDKVELNGRFSIELTVVEAESRKENQRVVARKKLSRIGEMEQEVIAALQSGDRQGAQVTQQSVMQAYEEMEVNAENDADNYIQVRKRRAVRNTESLFTSSVSNKDAEFQYQYYGSGNLLLADTFHDEL